MYVVLWRILPNLEGEGKEGQKEGQNSQQLQRLEKSNTTDFGAMSLAACSTQPLSSLCDLRNTALALAAAFKAMQFKLQEPGEFFLRITFSTWFSLSSEWLLNNCLF